MLLLFVVVLAMRILMLLLYAATPADGGADIVVAPVMHSQKCKDKSEHLSLGG